MGDYEGWAQPSGLLPGEAGFVTRPLDRERWAIAEERTAELIARIQPNRPSEERRTAVVKYVQGLIHKCFNCRVFTFGSVPLKTYLPDGDIDLTAFSKHQNLKDTWAKEVCSVLEREEKSEYAEFHVKEVHYIQAEVKIIKCLVENIVVDISFNQLGGLCTLCFLEKVDHLIGQNHLFKRSIILVKAWCYYESRILGAHHGLISTYALETLVLYIFHVFNNSFSGPLEVLYRFLAFFSNFDWDNYCVSLWGPILLSSLPEMTAEPPRKDGGELLLDQQRFLDACSSVYAVFPDGHENQGQSFVSKHFNVVDPLRTSNNLGRSVNKGNFFRIRSAFGFGARQLARILECPIESIISEIDQFFMNTWDRHGCGQRPDAPSPDLWHLQPAQLDSVDNINDNNGLQTFHVDDEESKGKPAGEAQIISQHILPSSIQGDGSKCFQGTPSSLTGLLTHPAGNSSLASPLDQESLTTKASLSAVSRGGASKSTSNKSHHQQLSALASDQSSKHINEIGSTTKSQKGFKGDLPGGESEDKLRFHFARPRSSPDLRGVPKEVSRGRRSRGETIEALTNQVASLSFDHSAVDRRKMNMSSNSSSLYTSKATVASDALALRRISSQENIGTGNYSETSNCSNSLSSAKESQGTSLAVQREEAIQADDIMETIVPSHHDEQDPINLTGFQRPQFVNRQSPQIHLPVNFASFQLPVPIGPSLLTSVAYAPANLSGTGHTSLPLADRNWGPGGQLASYSSQQFPQGSAPPLAPYVPNLGIGTHAHSDNPGAFDKLGASGSYHEDEEVQYNPSFWQKVDEHDTLLGPAGGLDMKGVKGYHGGQSESDLANHEKSTSPMGPASATPAPYLRAQKKFVKDARGLPLEGQTDLTMHYSPARFMDDNGVDPNWKAVPTSSFESSSTRISESTWTGAAGRVSKFPKEKRGRGRGSNHVEFSNSKQRETFSSSYGKSNSGWQAEPTLDHPMIGNETVNRDLHSFGAANVDSLNHGDHFSSSLHVSKSSIPPPASDSALPAHLAVRNIGPISPVPSQVQPTSMSGYDSGSGISSDSVIPGGNLSPVVMGQGPRQRAMDNGGVLPFTFYPTGPPFPFVAMLPLYNIPTDSGSSGDSPTRFDRMGPTDDSIDNHVDQPEHSLDSSSSYDLSECPEQAGIFSSSNMESGDGLFIDHGDEMKSDILHSDFVSHWQNLQFGRFCQNPQLSDPVFYQPQVLIPPMYLQGHFPWDGPGRPLPVNMSTLTHLLSYGHRFVPVAALQPNSSRPVGNFQRFSAPNRLFGEELPRYRGGTGTYLPNPRQVPHRDRQSSGSRGNRGNYGQDRNDHGDRDAGWVFIPKNRGGGRGQNKYDGRNRNEKSSSRVERNYEGKGGERGWDSYRHDNLRRGSYQVQHAPFSSGSSSINTGNVMPHGSGGMPYGVYHLPSMNTNGNVPSIPGNGSAVPSVVMLYPYDHNMGFTPEPLEFGSLGPVQLGGSQEGRFNDGIARLNDGHFYEHKHKSYQTNSSPGHSPSDQPSSPKQHQRSSMQRSYQLKEEDFPPLRNQSGRGGSNRFSTGNNSSSRNSHYQAFLVTPSS